VVRIAVHILTKYCPSSYEKQFHSKGIMKSILYMYRKLFLLKSISLSELHVKAGVIPDRY